MLGQKYVSRRWKTSTANIINLIYNIPFIPNVMNQNEPKKYRFFDIFLNGTSLNNNNPKLSRNGITDFFCIHYR